MRDIVYIHRLKREWCYALFAEGGFIRAGRLSLSCHNVTQEAALAQAQIELPGAIVEFRTPPKITM